MYSDAFRPDRAMVRTIPQTSALSMSVSDMITRKPAIWMDVYTHKTPRLRPQAMVIFSLRFMLRSQITNHGRMAKEKSAATNQAVIH